VGQDLRSDLKELAGRFLAFIEEATGLAMIVCDETGTIIECRDRKRLGVQHAIATRIMSGEADELFVTAEEAARDSRMKEGCNVAIVSDGRRLGTFGIAGPVTLARPLVRVAAAVFASWLRDQRQQNALTTAAARVFAGVQKVSTRTAEVSSEAAQVVDHMTAALREVSAKVETSGEIIRSVQEVAQKSRILSINGSVEAARAGDQGRGFAVVAREMLALAEDARVAANQIQTTLGDVQRAIGSLEESVHRSASLAQIQTTALTDIKVVVGGLQGVVEDLSHAQR